MYNVLYIYICMYLLLNGSIIAVSFNIQLGICQPLVDFHSEGVHFLGPPSLEATRLFVGGWQHKKS